MYLGAVRRTDTNGRIQIPSEIRDFLGLDGVDINVYVQDGKCIIERMNTAMCSICGTKFTANFGHIVPVGEKKMSLVCSKCVDRWGRRSE